MLNHICSLDHFLRSHENVHEKAALLFGLCTRGFTGVLYMRACCPAEYPLPSPVVSNNMATRGPRRKTSERFQSHLERRKPKTKQILGHQLHLQPKAALVQDTSRGVVRAGRSYERGNELQMQQDEQNNKVSKIFVQLSKMLNLIKM